MAWKSFTGGVGVGVAGALALVLFWPKPAWHGYVGLPDLELVNLQSPAALGDASLEFTGALVGADLAFPNNVFKMMCDHDTLTCHAGIIEQVGDDQIGDIELSTYKITQWTPDFVEAVDDEFCGKITISIDRKDRHVAYTQEPQNTHSEACKNGNTDLQRLELGRPIYWRKLDPKGRGLIS